MAAPAPAFRCHRCEDPIAASGYCRHCIEDSRNGRKPCARCGEWNVPDEDDEHVCVECFDRLAVVCCGCQVLILPDDAQPGDLCESCYSKAEDSAPDAMLGCGAFGRW